ncbi:MAG: hypothetical protein FD181_2763 [Prolixibacteraceae bacterium]|nr:MAG: hypothetical protein FD181_2763 [Prolixibacteraceae bacterium]
MKRLIVFSILTLGTITVSAQFANNWLNNQNKHLLYTNFDLMMGTNTGGNVGMNFVYNCKYSVQVGYSSDSNKPAQFVQGFKSGTISETGASIIQAKMMENYDIMIGRHFDLSSKGALRFIVQGGPGMSILHDSSEPEKDREFSIMINTKIEFPIIDMLGFTAGPTLVMNQERQNLTFCVGFIYGIISEY